MQESLVDRRLREPSEQHRCMDVSMLFKTRPVSATCTADDRTALNAIPGGNAEGSFPKMTSDCSMSSLNFVTGINPNKFNLCLTGQVKITTGCSTCFAEAAQYGYKSCKKACFASWCSETCLQCSAGFNTTACTGFTAPQPTPCKVPPQIELSDEMSMPSVTLIGLFAGSAVTFAVLRFRHKASTTGEKSTYF